MLRIEDEELRICMKRLLEESDTGDDKAYEEYRQFCEKFNCAIQDMDTFREYLWDENDDVGNLFKFVSGYCYGDDEEDYKITEADFSHVLFKYYLEEKPFTNIIPSIRFISPIPFWLFYFANIYYKLRPGSQTVNRQLLTIQIMLSNYDEQYWKNGSPPKWEQKEQELLEALCSHPFQSKNPVVQYDGKELFRMLYYRSDNTKGSIYQKLIQLTPYAPKILSEEMSIILKMENSIERSHRLTKLLEMLGTREITTRCICKQDLYKIVGDELEELGNREMALELCKKFTHSQDDLFCFLSLCKNSPNSIQQKAFYYASQIPIIGSDEDKMVKLILEGAINFPIVNTTCASTYIKFLQTHIQNIQQEHEDDIPDLFYKLQDHIHEIDSYDAIIFSDILDSASPEFNVIAEVLPLFMERIKKATTQPSDALVNCFAKHYRIINIIECMKECPRIDKTTKQQYQDFLFWYLNGREIISTHSIKEILLSRVYFDFDSLDPTMSNIDYLFNYFLNHLEKETDCIIYLLCEYIHHDIPIPDQKITLKKIKNSVKQFSRQNRCAIAGLVSLICPKTAFKMAKKINLSVPIFPEKQYSSLIQYGVLYLLEYILDNHPDYDLSLTTFANVADNVMVQTIYTRVYEKISAD